MRKYRALAIGVIIADTGLALINAGQAATLIAHGEAEAGTLAGNARNVSDGSASGSAAVAFMASSASGSRDPLKQPFASTSIWNMPIGSGAQYVAANLPANPGSDEWTPMPQIDDEPIIMKPAAPLTSLRQNNAGWSGGDRCAGSGSELAKLPIPADYIIGNSGDNNSAAILSADGHTVVQSQPFTRCTAGGPATSLLTFPNEDLYGAGISGSHGGSYLSALGGSIRTGELRPGQQGPKHALK